MINIMINHTIVFILFDCIGPMRHLYSFPGSSSPQAKQELSTFLLPTRTTCPLIFHFHRNQPRVTLARIFMSSLATSHVTQTLLFQHWCGPIIYQRYDQDSMTFDPLLIHFAFSHLIFELKKFVLIIKLPKKKLE